jgi:hypothetical protein
MSTGSSRLTPEQQQFYTRRFGVTYHHVPEQPWTAPRRDRRKLRFKPKAER